MRSVICCDQLCPSELLRDALTVGGALVDRGWEVAYVVGDPVSLVDYAGSWPPNELFQAPVLRDRPRLVMKRPPVDGFADHMASAGFDDKKSLLALASIWNRQLRLLKPDVIVGLYSPVAWLVGPTHVPTFAIGNGFVLPPVLGTSFPRLSPDSTPLADEMQMLSNANAVLARLGHSPLAALSEVLGGCTQVLYGLPAFDPYLQLRRSVTTGLLGDEVAPAMPPLDQRLAFFLDAHCPGVETVILAVASFRQCPIDIFIGGATEAMRRFLEQQPNVTVYSDHKALLDKAATASAVVHHGSQDVAQRCVALGRPQLLIPWTREQEVLNYMVGWMAFTWSKPPTTQLGEMAGTLRDLLRDASLVVAAQHHARQLAQSNLSNALPGLVDQVAAAEAS
jgi:hypothetical protein